MTTNARPRFRLQLQGLTEMDIAKIHAFLRVGQHRFECNWDVVSDGACDVLVSGDPRLAPAATHGVAAILHLSDAPGPRGPDALSRPLQYDAFIDAMSLAERALADGAIGAAAPELGAALATPPSSVEDVPVARPLVPYGAGLRLLRWPPASILGAHRYNVRLASFMSGRHVRLDQLIELSNVDRLQCEQFIAELSNARILDVKPPETAPRRAPISATLIPAAVQQVSARDSMFRRIRSRLGLGGST